MEEESIQFIANTKGWTSIKKMKVTPATDPRAFLEFLASLNTGIDRKVEEFLGRIVDLNKVDKVLSELFEGKAKPEEIIQKVNGSTINKVVSELTTSLKLQPGEQKEIAEFLKVYAMRKALKQNKIRVDYSEIDIPGMKRLKKGKGKE